MSTTRPDRPSLAPRHWPVWLGVGLCMALARLPWGLQRALGAATGGLALRLQHSYIGAVHTDFGDG